MPLRRPTQSNRGSLFGFPRFRIIAAVQADAR